MRTLALLVMFAACKGSDKAPAPPTPSPTTPPTTPSPMTAPPPPASPNGPPTDLAKGANQLGLELWAHVPPGNQALSPASIAIPLTIAWGGAKGATAQQLANLLHLPAGPADVTLSRWGNLGKSLAATDKALTLKIANRLYGEKTYDIDKTYFTIVRHAFDVWIEPVDFLSDAEDARRKINTWVAEQTEQRIKGLLPPRSLGPATKLVIVNAIYFLADWAKPFDPSSTEPSSFWVNGTTEQQRPTMTQIASFPYAKADKATLVELPYKGGSASMYILVPDARDGLPALEKQLTTTLRALQSKLADERLRLSLPKFTIDPVEPMKLDRALQALGMVDAFDSQKADFAGIASPKDPRDKLYVSSVIHKAFVKVDEKGTEAAAATALGAPGGGPPAAPTQLAIDRPFLFVIVDKATGMMLFIGRVTDPVDNPG